MSSSKCQHVFIDEDAYKVCGNCGLEVDLLINDTQTFSNYGTAKNNSNYSVKVTHEDYSVYLEGIPMELRKKIITTFEQMLQQTNQRGEGKKAILAACYFYLLSDANYAITQRETFHRFKLNKKKFTKGAEYFLQKYKDYRTMTKRISDFVDSYFERFSFPIEHKAEALRRTKLVDRYSAFANSDPSKVCACIVFNLLIEKDDYKPPKNLYIRGVGMSDETIKKINSKLDMIMAKC